MRHWLHRTVLVSILVLASGTMTVAAQDVRTSIGTMTVGQEGMKTSIGIMTPADKTVPTSMECTVARVAERAIAVHYPDFDSIKFPPVVLERESFWIVYYKLSNDMMGGTPIVEIEKGSFRVIKVYHDQ